MKWGEEGEGVEVGSIYVDGGSEGGVEGGEEGEGVRGEKVEEVRWCSHWKRSTIIIIPYDQNYNYIKN